MFLVNLTQKMPTVPFIHLYSFEFLEAAGYLQLVLQWWWGWQWWRWNSSLDKHHARGQTVWRSTPACTWGLGHNTPCGGERNQTRSSVFCVHEYLSSHWRHLHFEPNSCPNIPVVYECLEAGRCLNKNKTIRNNNHTTLTVRFQSWSHCQTLNCEWNLTQYKVTMFCLLTHVRH